jgi:hypothetical protein
MAQPNPPTLEYATPQGNPTRIGVTPFIAGTIAGAVTCGFGFLVHPLVMFVIAPICGLIVGFICAGAAKSRVFRASIVGNAMALPSLLCLPTLAQLFGGYSRFYLSRVEWGSGIAAVAVFAALFILPGLFASLCICEGRRMRSKRMPVAATEQHAKAPK